MRPNAIPFNPLQSRASTPPTAPTDSQETIHQHTQLLDPHSAAGTFLTPPTHGANSHLGPFQQFQGPHDLTVIEAADLVTLLRADNIPRLEAGAGTHPGPTAPTTNRYEAPYRNPLYMGLNGPEILAQAELQAQKEAMHAELQAREKAMQAEHERQQAELQAKAEKLQAKAGELQAKAGELQAKEKAMQAKEEAMRAKEEAMQAKEEAMQAEHERQQAELQAQKEVMQAEHERQQAELQAKAEKLQAKAGELQAKAEELQAKAEKLQAKAEELQTKAEELQTKAEELQTKAEELEAKAEELQAKAEELQARETARNLKDKEKKLQAQKESTRPQDEARTKAEAAATSLSLSPAATSPSPSPAATSLSLSPAATSLSPSPTATSLSPSPTATPPSPSPAATAAATLSTPASTNNSKSDSSKDQAAEKKGKEKKKKKKKKANNTMSHTPPSADTLNAERLKLAQKKVVDFIQWYNTQLPEDIEILIKQINTKAVSSGFSLTVSKTKDITSYKEGLVDELMLDLGGKRDLEPLQDTRRANQILLVRLDRLRDQTAINVSNQVMRTKYLSYLQEGGACIPKDPEGTRTRLLEIILENDIRDVEEAWAILKDLLGDGKDNHATFLAQKAFTAICDQESDETKTEFYEKKKDIIIQRTVEHIKKHNVTDLEAAIQACNINMAAQFLAQKAFAVICKQPSDKDKTKTEFYEKKKDIIIQNTVEDIKKHKFTNLEAAIQACNTNMAAQFLAQEAFAAICKQESDETKKEFYEKKKDIIIQNTVEDIKKHNVPDLEAAIQACNINMAAQLLAQKAFAVICKQPSDKDKTKTEFYEKKKDIIIQKTVGYIKKHKVTDLDTAKKACDIISKLQAAPKQSPTTPASTAKSKAGGAASPAASPADATTTPTTRDESKEPGQGGAEKKVDSILSKLPENERAVASVFKELLSQQGKSGEKAMDNFAKLLTLRTKNNAEELPSPAATPAPDGNTSTRPTATGALRAIESAAAIAPGTLPGALRERSTHTHMTTANAAPHEKNCQISYTTENNNAPGLSPEKQGRGQGRGK
jgi:hypothetical protein